MEERAPYIVNGKDTQAPGLSLIGLLEQARTEFRTKQLRHERKLPKAKRVNDQQFHQHNIAACKIWIESADVMLAELRRGILYHQNVLFQMRNRTE